MIYSKKNIHCLVFLAILSLIFANAHAKKEPMGLPKTSKPGPASQKSQTDPEKIAEKRKDMCSALQQCMGSAPSVCAESDLKPNEDIDYNTEFCQYHHRISKLGIQPVGNNQDIYAFLGREYRVTYSAEGEVPVNKEMMQFLFNHLEFTGKLVNAYMDSKYHLEYTRRDRRSFKGTNGRSLFGSFRIAWRDETEQHQVFWGFGGAKVLMWKLIGHGLAFIDYVPMGTNQVHYKLEAVAFPGNGVLNGIMQMGLFRNVVTEKINHIVEDVTSAASKFATGDLDPISKHPDLIPGGAYHETLLEFLDVIEKSDWQVKGK